MNTEKRPWGHYEVLYSGIDCQVKRIEIEPGKRISLQSHKFRNEHWFITSGKGTVQINEQIRSINAGDMVDIPIGTKHRVAASDGFTLSFIEVQTGVSFDELDIIRYDDDYGRAG